MPTYSLAELAQLADVTPRTVRYCVSQGLLPAPDAQGPNTRYTDDHLARLRAIKKLQGAHFPLAEIRSRLRSFTTGELESIAELSQPAAADSAVDYIRDVLQPTYARRAYSLPVPPPAPAGAPQATGPAPTAIPAQATIPPQTPTPAQSDSPLARSQWERIPLDPDIELHVRRPLTRQSNKRVERLIAIARELFEED